MSITIRAKTRKHVSCSKLNILQHKQSVGVQLSILTILWHYTKYFKPYYFIIIVLLFYFLAKAATYHVCRPVQPGLELDVGARQRKGREIEEDDERGLRQNPGLADAGYQPQVPGEGHGRGQAPAVKLLDQEAHQGHRDGNYIRRQLGQEVDADALYSDDQGTITRRTN